MKHLSILIFTLLIQSIALSQTSNNSYPFKIEIKGKGQPVVFIPGMASSSAVWNETVDSLKMKYQCHILTLAGFDNEKPMNLEKGFLPIMKEEIAKYIKNELKEKPILIGHSLGGFLALSIASAYPELFSKSIIVDSYPFGPLLYNPNATTSNTMPQAKQVKEMLLNATKSQFSAQQQAALKMMITDATTIQRTLKWTLVSDRATIAQATFELMTTDLRNNIENISIPILVLGSWYGLKNYGITKQAVATQFNTQFSKVANVTIKIAATAKHFIMLDDPDWFINSIVKFIASNEE